MIKTHAALAEHVAGRSVLLLNSYGKDSILCMEWLHNYAHPSRIVSMNYRFLAPHPLDVKYEQYLRKRYPRAEFLNAPNALEVSRIMQGVYQSPLDTMEFDKMEFNDFDTRKRNEEFRISLGCDYICLGLSRHESFQRANFFHKNGILDEEGHKIYPLGFMSKDQIHSLIKSTGIKVHPVYKLAKSTLDQPSYFRMRSTFIAHPEYYSAMLEYFPMLALDRYRYEVLL